MKADTQLICSEGVLVSQQQCWQSSQQVELPIAAKLQSYDAGHIDTYVQIGLFHVQGQSLSAHKTWVCAAQFLK
eukprot:2220055-Amphidinium_carterae.3